MNYSKNVVVPLSIFFLSMFTFLSATNASELNTLNKGLEVARKIDSHDRGWINQIADAQMVLKNSYGQESKRSLQIKTLEVENDGDKTLTIFKSPRDVKGTGFLSFSHATKPDDQWLYLPALRRVKRISSDNKSGPFMGSEFAYEDISSQEVDKYSYEYLREEEVAGAPGHVIIRYPVDKNSGYTKQLVWVDSQEYRIHKIDFYDRKGSLLKTLNYEGYKQYAGNIWRADLMRMVNHQNGKSTDLVWSDYRFGTKINKRDFDKNALKRLK